MDWKRLRTCVTPDGSFVFGIHRPRFRVANLREKDAVGDLGATAAGRVVDNRRNFPEGDVEEPGAGPVVEIANPLPFRGATYILQRSADRIAADRSRIAIPPTGPVSLSGSLAGIAEGPTAERIMARLPGPLKLALATTSTDPADLVFLARSCCTFIDDPDSGLPTGLLMGEDGTPRVQDGLLFEAVSNNPRLPDPYKEVMVLRPGVQGGSEIVGEWGDAAAGSRIFEYLRRNSYIPWGHYAANMAHDAVRYRIRDLSAADVAGMRHLYYQRTFVRLAENLDLPAPGRRKRLSPEALESLRRRVLDRISGSGRQEAAFSASLWGWNFGFDYAPSGYRLHASHQQVHQQYALVPACLDVSGGPGPAPVYACGDLVGDFCRRFRKVADRPFFDAYLAALRTNQRIDGHPTRPASLVVHEDEHCLVCAPKAQTSQWELVLMPKSRVGNVLEADSETRGALDRSILLAAKTLEKMGAAMITAIEFSKRFDEPDDDQRLFYSFLPRLPESPGAFSEAQLRWINGHYPEDFAAACREHLEPVLQEMGNAS